MSRSAACRWSPSRTRTAPSACTRVRRGHARDRVFRGGTIHRVDLESGRWIVARLGSTRFVLARRGTDADDARALLPRSFRDKPRDAKLKRARSTRRSTDARLTTDTSSRLTSHRGWRALRPTTSARRSRRPRRRLRRRAGVAPDETAPRGGVRGRCVEDLVAARATVRGGRGDARGKEGR